MTNVPASWLGCTKGDCSLSLKDYIGEATSYDKKLLLERKDLTNWLKSVSAFANTQGGRLLFGVANDGALAGLADAQDDAEFISETVVPRFESTRTDFFLILPNLNYGRKINGVETSSEHFDPEVATEADTEKTGLKTGMNAGDTVNLPVNLPVNPSVNPPVNPPVNLPVNPPRKEVRATLTKSARAVLVALESDSSLTYDALAAKLKLHRDTIRVSIASLVRMNLLRRVGSDKTGHWEVVK